MKKQQRKDILLNENSSVPDFLIKSNHHLMKSPRTVQNFFHDKRKTEYLLLERPKDANENGDKLSFNQNNREASMIIDTEILPQKGVNKRIRTSTKNISFNNGNRTKLVNSSQLSNQRKLLLTAQDPKMLTSMIGFQKESTYSTSKVRTEQTRDVSYLSNRLKSNNSQNQGRVDYLN